LGGIKIAASLLAGRDKFKHWQKVKCTALKYYNDQAPVKTGA